MKRIFALLVSLLLLSSLLPVYALESGEARSVIGADLSQDEIAAVYALFGIERGSVTELTLTNAEEREALGGEVDEERIGSNSISCVYIRTLSEGAGYLVSVHNVNWCSEEMYQNALITAGIHDVEIVVAAPYPVSGTAALAGIYKAYEDMSGQTLPQEAKALGIRELVITGELSETMDSLDASGIVNEVKLMLAQSEALSDEELEQEILSIAQDYRVTLNDHQVSQLVMLCRQMEKLGEIDLAGKVGSLRDMIKKLGELRDKAESTREKLGELSEKAGVLREKLSAFSQDVQALLAKLQPLLDRLNSLVSGKE